MFCFFLDAYDSRYVITYRASDGTGNVAETSVTAVVEDALGPSFTYVAVNLT